MIPNDFVKGDTAGIFEAVVSDKGPVPKQLLDLTGSTGELKYRIAGGTLKTKTMAPLSPQSDADKKGRIQVALSDSADLYASGEMLADVRIIDGSGKVITNLDPIELMVREPLA